LARLLLQLNPTQPEAYAMHTLLWFAFAVAMTYGPYALALSGHEIVSNPTPNETPQYVNNFIDYD
jgi:hypothetical protein